MVLYCRYSIGLSYRNIEFSFITYHCPSFPPHLSYLFVKQHTFSLFILPGVKIPTTFSWPNFNLPKIVEIFIFFLLFSLTFLSEYKWFFSRQLYLVWPVRERFWHTLTEFPVSLKLWLIIFFDSAQTWKKIWTMGIFRGNFILRQMTRSGWYDALMCAFFRFHTFDSVKGILFLATEVQSIFYKKLWNF